MSGLMTSLRTRVKGSPLLRVGLFLLQNARRSVAPSWQAGYPGREDGAATSGARAPRHFLSAFVRAKNEARFLPEWMAHHHGLGFEHFHVYDNNSTDDLARAIRPFIERGLATHTAWPQVPASPGSNFDFLERHGRDSRWVAFFDADEFLFEREAGACLRLLRTHASWPALAVNFRYFGSAGHERIPRGLVTAAFDRCDSACDHHVKVIARPAAFRAYRNSHNSYYHGGRLARTADGRRVFGTFVEPGANPELVLNHYVYRSREDYERKARGGFVDAASAREQARRADKAEREFHRHNEARATPPEAVLARTRGLLREFGYPPEFWEAG